MAWVDLSTYLSDLGGYVEGSTRNSYSSSPYYGSIGPDFPTESFVGWYDFGCGTDYPLMAHVQADDFYNEWNITEGYEYHAQNSSFICRNALPDESNTAGINLAVPRDFLPDGTLLRARAFLLGDPGEQVENYRDAVIGIGYSNDVYNTTTLGYTITQLTEPGGFANETYTPWVEFTEDSDLGLGYNNLSFVCYRYGCSGSFGPFALEIQVWIPDPLPPGYKVYELDKGWSFDGNYIPHFLEMNWYFGDDPFTDKTIQKVRIHGLAKGLAQLQLSVAGMQHEYDSDYTEPQLITLPRNAATISSEYMPTTNYVDSSNWGVSIQLKFEGSNTDLTKPEPSHVLQVLALQGSPQENGRRIN